ncbi:hypothetical protein [Leptospira noguchii]|uniref:hypothetical protein n=1 Tax=Leptospira noguchii TaxID=28182 RepID=UPI0007737439|nr:hypothetical protein [Leptospira noguchii]
MKPKILSPVSTGRRAKLPLKLALLAGEGATLNRLAQKHHISRPMISQVIQGKKSSKKVNSILIEEWGITVEEARTLYREDAERRYKNPVTRSEAWEYQMKINHRKMEIQIPFAKWYEMFSGLSSQAKMPRGWK